MAADVTIRMTEHTQCKIRPPWGVGSSASDRTGEFADQIFDQGMTLASPIACLTVASS